MRKAISFLPISALLLFASLASHAATSTNAISTFARTNLLLSTDYLLGNFGAPTARTATVTISNLANYAILSNTVLGNLSNILSGTVTNVSVVFTNGVYVTNFFTNVSTFATKQDGSSVLTNHAGGFHTGDFVFVNGPIWLARSYAGSNILLTLTPNTNANGLGFPGIQFSTSPGGARLIIPTVTNFLGIVPAVDGELFGGSVSNNLLRWSGAFLDAYVSLAPTNSTNVARLAEILTLGSNLTNTVNALQSVVLPLTNTSRTATTVLIDWSLSGNWLLTNSGSLDTLIHTNTLWRDFCSVSILNTNGSVMFQHWNGALIDVEVKGTNVALSASAVDKFTFERTGTNVYGSVVTNFANTPF